MLHHLIRGHKAERASLNGGRASTSRATLKYERLAYDISKQNQNVLVRTFTTPAGRPGDRDRAEDEHPGPIPDMR